MYVEKFDFIVYLMVIVITALELVQLNYENANFIVIILFMVMGIYFFARIAKHNSNISIYRMMYIFCYIFFFMAPIQQYTSGVVFWKSNGYSLDYEDADYIVANIAIMVFMIFFDLTYHYCKKRKLIRNIGMNRDDKYSKNDIIFNTNISTMFILCAVSLMAFLILIVTNNITKYSTIVSNSSVNMQLQYILRFIPVVCLMITVLYYKKTQNRDARFFLAVYSVECVIIFFPLWGNMARFFLLGSYIVVFSLFFATNHKKKALVFLLFVIGFCFAFSDLRYITSLTELQTITINFNHVDFDAYQMLMGMMRYVKEEGISYGKNYISALAFLIPRTIWTEKLEASGAIVVRHYGSWFKNVSMPLVGESYFSFGWFGVGLFAVFFGKIASLIDSWSDEVNPFKRCTFCLIAGMSIYIMRGTLLAAFAFVFGILLAIILVCILFKTKIVK